ncbi:uncharacterized protein LOC135367917 [Ornithodoros turicata]|uniref:uncharacterized protein LOC135367917 n=1 Tax=Ornithodoros turicata TaxID=34597 RepID=UPI00313A1944
MRGILTVTVTLQLVRWSTCTTPEPVGARVSWDALYLRSGALNLTCSVAFRTFAHTRWSLNGRPLEDDTVLETILTGRREGGLMMRAHRLEVPRLQRLPSPSGLYNFSCAAVADGELSCGSAFVTTFFQDSCRPGVDDDCRSRGGICRSGQCECARPRPVRLRSRHTTCRHSSRLGWPCTYDEQCSFLVAGAYCGITRTCQCAAGREPDAQGLRCSAEQSQATPPQPSTCQSHSDCSASLPAAVCGADHVCRCRSPKELCPRKGSRKGDANGNTTSVLQELQQGLTSRGPAHLKHPAIVIVVAAIVLVMLI